MRREGVVLIGGVHRQPREIPGEADLRRIGPVADMAGIEPLFARGELVWMQPSEYAALGSCLAEVRRRAGITARKPNLLCAGEETDKKAGRVELHFCRAGG